ncbi:MAG: purine-binding chemotaxis protein CheW [Rubrivivax sp.]|nr:purine-binding chemotaxis protein CheW [Rubrivivax sp.]
MSRSQSSAAAAAKAAPPPTLPAAHQWLRLAVGDTVCALPIDHVREILQVGRLTPLPRLPEVVRGVMNLRGAVVPVIDLGARLHGRPTVVGRRSCIIVVELPATGGQPALVAGVMVDAVFEVVDVAGPEASAPPPLGTHIAPEHVQGIYQAQGRMVHLLDIERVLAQHALTELVAAHVC